MRRKASLQEWLQNLFQGMKVHRSQPLPEEVTELNALAQFMQSLLDCDHYVARSEYQSRLEEASALIRWIRTLEKSGTLNAFCRRRGVSLQSVQETLEKYDTFPGAMEARNAEYVRRTMEAEKEYLDHILDACDPGIRLDDNQREVVLTDEDYCLVVAGAGAGKTTTVAAKVRYLVERQGIDPAQILIISFTNKAVNELRQHIQNELKLPCPIATFHSTGNAIMHKQNPEKMNIVEESRLYYVIRDYLRSSVLRNESMVNRLILFFGTYFDAPFEGQDLNAFFNHIAGSRFVSMRGELDAYQKQILDVKTRKMVTIQSEMLRSREEVEIANFLYLHTLDYEYEPLYPYHIEYARKPYTPDFRIMQGEKTAYIEHFGITEDGRNDRYSRDELESYKKAVNDKILLHRKHGTKLIYTFSAYRDGRPMLEHLQQQLLDAGFELKPRSGREVLEKLVASEENRYIRRLVALLCRFIVNFKTNGYTVEEFDRMLHATKNERTRLFLYICRDCYLEYERFLHEHHAVDFQDMINESARILREARDMHEKLSFRYVIVDEYQDISRQRFDLVRALREVTSAKIMAVGDDWQSIYAFSGSDITLFTQFEEKMGYARLLKIVRTYRNAQEVIDIAGNFIQKNQAQLRKELISPRHIEDPVIIYTYSTRRKDPKANTRSGANYALAHAVETALEQIMEYNRAEGRPDSGQILLLGRYGFDGDKLEQSGLFEYITRGSRVRSVKYPQLNITFMTAHASKGLGYDEVIVLNGRNETYGFPSKIEEDPVLSFVIREDRSMEYAEERRLFYVAMTRTRNRVYLIAPEENPSEFLLEIRHDYKNVSLRGTWDENAQPANVYRKSCPVCGYPMQLRYKPAYGLRLYLCTNEPEVCGFMTNELRAGAMSILKCDQCRDGYLVVKPGRGGSDFILGCTNYKRDGTGCGRIMTREAYDTLMGVHSARTAAPVSIPSGRRSEPAQRPGSPAVPKSEPAQAEPERDVIRGAEGREILYKGVDLNRALVQTLQCLSDVSMRRFVSREMLIDLLRDTENPALKQARIPRPEDAGALRQLEREDAERLIHWLVERGYILETRGAHPVLHPTYQGRHLHETISGRQIAYLKRFLETRNAGHAGNGKV